jgi:uncharacterized membrane protein
MTLDGKSSSDSQMIADDNIRVIAQLQQQAAERRTVAQRVSDAVSAFASRESTAVLHALGFAVWIAVNAGLSPIRPFDPFPYNLLSILVSLEAIFLTLFVLASQNRMRQEEDRRAHLDLQINLLAEQEMTLVLQMLKEICVHLNLRGTIDSRNFVELVKQIDVGQLAERLDRTLGENGTPAPDPPPRDVS